LDVLLPRLISFIALAEQAGVDQAPDDTCTTDIPFSVHAAS